MTYKDLTKSSSLPLTHPFDEQSESSTRSSGTKRRLAWVILALTAFVGGVMFAVSESVDASLIITRISSLYLSATTTTASTSTFRDPLHLTCANGVMKTLASTSRLHEIIRKSGAPPSDIVASTPEFCVAFYKNVIIDMTAPTSVISPTQQRVVFDVIESKVCFDVATPEQIAAGAGTDHPESFATNFCNQLGLGDGEHVMMH